QVHALIAEPTASTAQLEAEARPHLPTPSDAPKLVARMRRALDDARPRAAGDRIEAERLKSRCGTDALYVEVPVMEHDVHDLGTLARVASYLVGERTNETITH